MNLLIEYYQCNNSSRDEEYLFSIKQNVDNNLISKIFVFLSEEINFPIKDQKIVIVKVNERPTYYDFFDYCNSYLDGQICIISNTDIFFDDTLKYITDSEMDNIFLALTRWDIFQQNQQWYLRYYDFLWREVKGLQGETSKELSTYTSDLSQDAWIFKSPIKLDDRCKFFMGKPGCDNRIAQIMYENHYVVKNPSKKIIIKHIHQTQFRTYNNSSDIVQGPYLLIKPTDDLSMTPSVKTIPHF